MPRAVVWAGIVITLAFVLLAILAPLVAPYDFDTYRDADGVRFVKQQAPSAEHLFGTNVMSTDVLSRVVSGARISLAVAALAVLVSMTIGAVVGLTAGYFGGGVDALLMRMVDAGLAIPWLFILLLLLAFPMIFLVLMRASQ